MGLEPLYEIVPLRVQRAGEHILARFQADLSYLLIITMSVFNASRLLNKTVLITGASGGIGAVCGQLWTVILF
jgi:hypothetical protein